MSDAWHSGHLFSSNGADPLQRGQTASIFIALSLAAPVIGPAATNHAAWRGLISSSEIRPAQGLA